MDKRDQTLLMQIILLILKNLPDIVDLVDSDPDIPLEKPQDN